MTLASVSLPFLPAQAEIIFERGVDGADGAAGLPGSPGRMGEPGGEASATATAPTDAVNRAQAVGGSGGQGGRGGTGGLVGVGGDGGQGGTATARADGSLDDANTDAQAIATGGDGGGGGLGELGRIAPGGHGGDATAEASLIGDASHVREVNASAAGGHGGEGFPAGAGGSADTRVSARITSPGETIPSLDGSSVGGDGGDSNPGPGAQVGTGARGGDARTAVEAIVESATRSRINSRAHGGTGGSSPLGSGGVGGDATASLTVEAVSLDNFSVTAVGGAGGDGTGLGYQGGNGGEATARISTDTSTGGRGTPTVSATGGDGGNGFEGADGGDGASVELIGDHDIAATDTWSLAQRAIGGDGGDASSSSLARATGGSGGDARVVIDRTVSTTELNLSNRAEGGDAGDSPIGSGTNRAGNATVTAQGTNQTGGVFLNSEAVGGRGGSGRPAGGGDAIARAEASGAGSRDEALASATGGSGGRVEAIRGRGTSGNAEAFASLSSDGNDGRATARATARGGPGDLLAGVSGAGGHGGNAAAEAHVDARGFHDSATSNATAFGGNGGNSNLPGVSGGNGGDATALATATHANAGFRTRAEVRATAGRGGNHLTGDAAGGNGGSATLVDAVDAESAGQIEIVYSTVGGSGGASGDNSFDGAGGDARSVLTFVNPTGGDVDLGIGATPGTSRRVGHSGTGQIAADVTSRGRVDVSASVAAAGDGDLEIGEIVARSTAGEEARASLSVSAQRYAFEVREDGHRHGRSILIQDQVRADTDGQHDVSQNARGSDGEFAGGDRSHGGNAESRLNYDAGSSDVRFGLNAVGGMGSPESGMPGAGNGGHATAHGDVSTANGSLGAIVRATGGTAGRTSTAAPAGRGGDAEANLFARQTGENQLAEATTRADGGDGGGAGDGGDASTEVDLETNSMLRGSAESFALGGSGDAFGAGGDSSAKSRIIGTGTGQYAVDAFARAGDGRTGGAADASAWGEAEQGSLTVSSMARQGASLGTTDTGAGQHGRSIEGSNVVSGSARELVLNQSLVAGQGGHAAVDGERGGDGGDARSTLSVAGNQASDLTLISSATAGRGGLGRGVDARSGRGGNSHVSAIAAETAGSVSVEAHATAGDGGFVFLQDEEPEDVGSPFADGADGGDGGQATFGRVLGESLNGGAVSVSAVGRGGDGGTTSGNDPATATGGNGASTLLDGLVQGSTTGHLSLAQIAIAGDGGSGEARGGDGGSARSTLDQAFDQSEVTVHLEAESGAAGRGRSGPHGLAGNAVATADLVQQGGDLSVTATARSRGSTTFTGTSEVDLVARIDGDGHRLTIGSEETGAEGGREARSRSFGLATGNSDVRVTDRAVGGSGGFEYRQDGSTTKAGNNAISVAEGRSNGSAPLQVQSIAIGGSGGQNGDGVAGRGGEASASATGVSLGGGDVTVETFQQGGAGGFGIGETEIDGAGADSIAVNTTTGSTSGHLTLHQHAAGALNELGGGPGGDAQSTLHASNPGGGRITATAEATGGYGNGEAHAENRAEDSSGSAVTAYAIATGGEGRITGDLGGVATAYASGSSSATAPVDVLARATGGKGAFNTQGRDVYLENAVQGETRGTLTLRQEAIGGEAGRGSSNSGALRGGHARSNLAATNPLGGHLHLSSLARGGDATFAGGDATGETVGSATGQSFLSISDQAFGGTGQSGGSAYSSASGTAVESHRFEVTAQAIGGEALSMDGQSGDATATASGRTNGQASIVRAIAEAGAHAQPSQAETHSIGTWNRNAIARANTTAYGGNVATDSRAAARSGRVGDHEIMVVASASASGAGNLSTDSRAGSSAADIFESSALASATVEGIHERDGEWTRAGLSLESANEGPDIVLRSEINLQTAAGVLPPQGLFVSFIDVELVGDLFDNLRFQVHVDDEVLVDEDFVTAEEAAVFFGAVLSLDQLAGVEHALDLRFVLEGTSKSNQSGITAYFAIASNPVPEPGTALLLGFGLIALSKRPHA